MKKQFDSKDIPKIKVKSKTFILHTVEVVKPFKISYDDFNEFISSVNYNIAKNVGFNFRIHVINLD